MNEEGKAVFIRLSSYNVTNSAIESMIFARETADGFVTPTKDENSAEDYLEYQQLSSDLNFLASEMKKVYEICGQKSNCSFESLTLRC